MLEPGEIRICRACIRQITDGNYTEIDKNSVKNNLYELIFCYIPEFEIEVENPCLCYECFSTLYLFHKFKKRCLRTEEDLRLYVRERPKVEVVDLYDVLIQSGDDVDEAVESATDITQLPESATQVETLEIKKSPRADDNYACTQCDGLSFGSRVELCDHLADVHEKPANTPAQPPPAPTATAPPKPRIKTCAVCQKCLKQTHESVLRQRLRESYTTATNNSGTACLLCGKLLKGPKTMAMHVLQNKHELKYRCPSCERSFLELSDLNAHMRLAHPTKEAADKTVCPYCAQVLSSKEEYDRHVECHGHAGVSKFACDVCKWVYFSESDLQAHQQSAHNMSIAVDD